MIRVYLTLGVVINDKLNNVASTYIKLILSIAE